jgi:Protein of unknown function (DUF1254)
MPDTMMAAAEGSYRFGRTPLLADAAQQANWPPFAPRTSSDLEDSAYQYLVAGGSAPARRQRGVTFLNGRNSDISKWWTHDSAQPEAAHLLDVGTPSTVDPQHLASVQLLVRDWPAPDATDTILSRTRPPEMEADEMSEPQQPSPQTSSWDELTSLRFPGNHPSKEASARLYDELQFQRACQVYLWALPAMNMVAMRDGQAAAFGSGYNVLAIWKDRISAKTIISTANPDVIYGLAFVDLKDGPLVFEAAPQMQGLLDDFWHRPPMAYSSSCARSWCTARPIRA